MLLQDSCAITNAGVSGSLAMRGLVVAYKARTCGQAAQLKHLQGRHQEARLYAYAIQKHRAHAMKQGLLDRVCLTLKNTPMGWRPQMVLLYCSMYWEKRCGSACMWALQSARETWSQGDMTKACLPALSVSCPPYQATLWTEIWSPAVSTDRVRTHSAGPADGEEEA